MASYVLLGFTAVVAVVALSGLGAVERLRGLSLAMLYPGVWLLGMGIFTGACMGKCQLGRILELGSEGDMGIGYTHGLFPAVA